MSERGGNRIEIVRVSKPGGGRSAGASGGKRGGAGECAALEPARALSAAPPTNRLPARRGNGTPLDCDDGHSTQLGCASALLAGRSGARDKVLAAILANVLAPGGSVILLTASDGEGPVESVAREVCAYYRRPERFIGQESGTRGFAPLAGCSEASIERFFCKKLAPVYVGHTALPSDGLRICFKAILHMARANREVARRVTDGVDSLEDLLELCEMSRMSEADRYARNFRHNAADALRAAQILGDYLRAFQDICVPDRNGERYNLFSPGLTVLRLNDQSVQVSKTVPWYLCQMSEMISEAADDNVTLLVDHVSDEVLGAFSGVAMNRKVQLVVACDNYMAFGTADLRARLDARFHQRFVFAHAEASSAKYWSDLSGERKVLLENYHVDSGSSHSFFQLPTVQRGRGRGYQETYRPKLEVNAFTQMRDNEGYLLESGSWTGELFHHFALP